ncbi:TonB-linked SusC/RagA family outer membrane protein [Dyadobacter jejuensis]|uniref:TonB-linked SusC/RagA family outer membrane protein n=1 Tax=Dyadobacter jejuensis TaxID=1082580 RepID=A0A316A9W7_9BACT|nr:TonB-dependent receptor [Dyadobacter jejuensis]PWJ54481.1 TonB-linked SusC/RagA family outer membrane protein [Dyadobacter jejuensis]
MKKSRLPHEIAQYRYVSSGRFLFLYQLSAKTMMTLCFLLSMVCQTQASTPSLASNPTKISIIKMSKPLKEALKEVEKQTPYRFFYNHQQINVAKVVNVNVVNSTIEKALNEIFKNTDIFYQVSGRQILLSPRHAHLPDSLSMLERVGKPHEPQLILHRIEGKITGTEGDPIPGVNVVVKGTTIGTSTNIEGEYVLNAPDKDVTLVYSFIGYKTKEVAVAGKSTLDVTLETDIQALGEVVVVGYGTEKRSDLTGSVTSIKADAIKNLPVRSVSEALQGRAAGVMINKESGKPGSNSQIIIRGVGSINGLNPLFVIDGIVRGNNSNFNPKDIESIEIIKDASAAAIYGAQAAGGVVLITTKKGSFNQKPSFNFSSNVGVRSITKSYKMLDTQDYIRARRGIKQDYGLWNDPNLPNTDWFDELFQSGQEQTYMLSMNGGTAKAKYYVSAGYERENGIQKSNYWERYSLRINNDYQLSKKFTFGHMIYMAKTSTNPATRGIPWRSLPYMAVRNEDGSFASVPGEVEFSGGNDVASLAYMHQKNGTLLLDGVLFADWELAKGLNFRTTAGGGFSGSFEDSFTEKNLLLRTALPESYTKSSSYGESYQLTTQLTYAKNFFEKHDFKIMAGYEIKKSNTATLSANATGFPVQVAESFALSTNPNKTASGALGYGRFLSQFARLNYTFDNRYILTANLRRDGSTKFGPDKRYGVFPSVGVGWKINEEAFFQNLNTSFITLLKPRLSWGILGNDAAISNFTYQPAYQQVQQHSFDEVNTVGGFNSIKVVNTAIKWEEINTINAGLDINMFGDRLSLSAEYYDRQTKDMLYNLPIPLSSGIAAFGAANSTMPVNIGKISNKGWEFTASYRDQKGELSYNITGNISQNFNKVLDLGLPNAYIYSGSLNFMSGNSPFKTVNGQPVGQIYGLIAEGLIQDQGQMETLNAIATEKALAAGTINAGATAYYNHQYTGPGDILYKDLNGDGKISDLDRTFIGNPWPKFQYGFNVDLAWKGIDFMVQFFGIAGRDIINGSKIFEQSFQQDYQSTYDIFGASYFLGNGLTDQPRLGLEDPSNPDKFILDPSRNYAWYSSYFVENGSFLKVKNLSIGYTLPDAVANKLKLQKFRIYLTGQNLLTFTKFTGLDPEFSNDVKNHGLYGINTYPQTKLFSVGLDLSF